MSESTLDQITVVDPEAQQPAAEVAQAPEYDAVTLAAMEMGYNPEYQGTPEKPAKTAKQFLDEGEKIGLKKQIRERENSLKSMELAMQQLIARQESIEEEIRTKVLKELNEKRRSAVEMADAEAFDKYNNEYEEYLKKTSTPQLAPPVEPQFTPEDNDAVASFISRNQSWFNTESVANMKLYNEAIETEKLIRAHKPELSTGEVLKEVEKYIKDTYTERFQTNLKTSAPPMVASGGRVSASGRKPTIHDLNACSL